VLNNLRKMQEKQIGATFAKLTQLSLSKMGIADRFLVYLHRRSNLKYCYSAGIGLNKDYGLYF
jgi:hypothetical protein